MEIVQRCRLVAQDDRIRDLPPSESDKKVCNVGAPSPGRAWKRRDGIPKLKQKCTKKTHPQHCQHLVPCFVFLSRKRKKRKLPMASGAYFVTKTSGRSSPITVFQQRLSSTPPYCCVETFLIEQSGLSYMTDIHLAAFLFFRCQVFSPCVGKVPMQKFASGIGGELKKWENMNKYGPWKNEGMKHPSSVISWEQLTYSRLLKGAYQYLPSHCRAPLASKLLRRE